MMFNVVMVKWGDKYGPEYVNILADAIVRNSTVEKRFIVFTDNPEGIDDGIETRPLPGNLQGWWNKLYLFSPEAGLEGRNIFFDLDTVITSNIDELFAYKGPFAILRDFYRPNGYGSAIMAWTDHHEIWDKFKAEGFPDIDGGDQAFIEKHVKNADRWQDFVKGIYSYKQNDCEKWPPHDTKIVCFHGVPNPHEIRGSWVPLVWKKGGMQQFTESKDFTNVTEDYLADNMEKNCKLDLPWFMPASHSNKKTLCIVGGSPSLKDNIKDLRRRIRLGAKVMSLNGSLKYLLSIGIKPDYHCQFDGRPENAGFLNNAPEGVKYLIGSMSHPSVLDKVKGRDVTLWHGGFDIERQKSILKPYDSTRPVMIIGGGTTVGLRAFYLGGYMGYKRIVAYGMDSSFRGQDHHAYSQPLNDKDGRIDVWLLGKKYECAPWMYRQAMGFKDVYAVLVNQGFSLNVIGDGLVPDICKYLNDKNNDIIQSNERELNVQ